MMISPMTKAIAAGLVLAYLCSAFIAWDLFWFAPPQPWQARAILLLAFVMVCCVSGLFAVDAQIDWENAKKKKLREETQ